MVAIQEKQYKISLFQFEKYLISITVIIFPQNSKLLKLQEVVNLQIQTTATATQIQLRNILQMDSYALYNVNINRLQ